MKKMEREKQNQTKPNKQIKHAQNALSVFTCLPLCEYIKTKDFILGIDWLCVTAAQPIHII